MTISKHTLSKTELEIVSTRDVYCDGTNKNSKDPALGHPRIYLHIKDKFIVCPYCSKKFELKK